MSEKQVKTKRVVKRRLNLKRVFLLALIIYLFYIGITSLLKINVSSVTVNGNNYVSDSTIIKLAGFNEKVPFFGFTEKTVCEKVESNGLIHSCKVTREKGWKVKITVEENEPLFYYSANGKIALSDGSMIDGENTYGVPTLINYVPEKVLLGFISGLSAIKSDIIHSISEIEYTPSANSDGTYIDDERFMLSMNDGNIVYINNKRLSILQYYEKVYASIGDKKGIFNFDSDYDNYYFQEIK